MSSSYNVATFFQLFSLCHKLKGCIWHVHYKQYFLPHVVVRTLRNVKYAKIFFLNIHYIHCELLIILAHCYFLLLPNVALRICKITIIKSKLFSATSGLNPSGYSIFSVSFHSSVNAKYVKHDIISVGNVMVEMNPVVCFSGVKLTDHSSL